MGFSQHFQTNPYHNSTLAEASKICGGNGTAAVVQCGRWMIQKTLRCISCRDMAHWQVLYSMSGYDGKSWKIYTKRWILSVTVKHFWEIWICPLIRITARISVTLAGHPCLRPSTKFAGPGSRFRAAFQVPYCVVYIVWLYIAAFLHTIYICIYI